MLATIQILFENVPPCPSIRNVYAAHYNPFNDKLFLKNYTLEGIQNEENCTKNVSSVPSAAPIIYNVGDWVLIQYHGDSLICPGGVAEVTRELLRVNVMERAGGSFKWSRKEDHVYYSEKNIIQKVEAPVVVRT